MAARRASGGSHLVVGGTRHAWRSACGPPIPIALERFPTAPPRKQGSIGATGKTPTVGYYRTDHPPALVPYGRLARLKLKKLGADRAGARTAGSATGRALRHD